MNNRLITDTGGFSLLPLWRPQRNIGVPHVVGISRPELHAVQLPHRGACCVAAVHAGGERARDPGGELGALCSAPSVDLMDSGFREAVFTRRNKNMSS